jgi:putative nucleotidyltransferase with HDIG domain
MPRTVVITSGKGGVGKTNFALNAALELTRRHYRTCLLDGDLGLANVNILLDIQPNLTLDDCIFGEVPLLDIIYKTESGLHIVPGSSGFEETANLSPEKIGRLVQEMDSLGGYDFLLIDTSSGISKGVISFCLAAPETILVLTPEATSLTDAYSVVKVLAGNGYDGTVKVLVNKCSDVPQAQKTFIRFKQVVNKHLDVNITAAGLILSDPFMERAVAEQEPVLSAFPNSTASQCIRAAVSNLIKTSVDLDKAVLAGTFWSRYFDFLRNDLMLPGQTTKPSPGEDARTSFPDIEPDAGPARPAVVEEGIDLESAPRQVDTSALFTLGCNATLPSLIPFLSRVLKLSSNQELAAPEMYTILSLDPVLLGRVLQLFITTYPTETVDRIDIYQMIEKLGHETVSGLLVTSALETAVKAPPEQKDYSFFYHLWLSGLRCGLLAKEIAGLLKHPTSEEAFFAGLLHDIGRLTMQRFQPSIYEHHPGENPPETILLDREKKHFRKTHAELGAEILRGFRLNSLMVDAAQFHILPASIMVTALDFNKIVYLAEQAGLPSSPDTESIIEKFLLSCGVSATDFKTLSDRVDNELDRITSEFQMGGQAGDIHAADQHEKLRQQAMAHILTQSIMPSARSQETLDGLMRAVTQGFSLLFGLNKVIWLFPDSEQNHLLARGYPGCIGFDWLSHISFRMDSGESLVVQSFLQRKIFSITGDPLDSLMDKQLLSAMQATLLLCLPLFTRTRSLGLIVCEVPEKKQQNFQDVRDGLQQFGAQVAARIAALEAPGTPSQSQP